ncbi:DUF159 family protein [Sphingomonas sp. DBB INV C78]|uniref:SOS response-associated peptidase n=1 Tax=Sphingomonas sp. DBB INV C78 TaxID=3349434 RepID=UPI0036D3DB88
MCNLTTARKSADEVAAYFRAKVPGAFNVAAETYPGTPGMVVIENEGVRELRSMVWGFPLILKAMRENAEKRGVQPRPKPVNNVADLSRPMWRGIAAKPQWRCLIPITAFAEAEGPKGAMTRTWFSMKSEPLFAWGGFWRQSVEWGDVYTGLMTCANEAIQPVHDRMPVLLHAHEHDAWLHGSIDDVIAFQDRKFPPELCAIERTSELWVKRKGVAEAVPMLL